MTAESELAELVLQLRRLGLEPEGVEAKAAVGGLPKTTAETISAFANGGGGTILLGLSEDEGFALAGGFDAPAVRDALAGMCANDLEPPVRDPIEAVPFEGGVVLRLDVSEADPLQKPVFVKARGPYAGSFIRGGDGDRRLTHYEVTQLLSNRSQPEFDREPVADATLEDLDPALVDAVIARAAERTPRAFANVGTGEGLVRVGAAVMHDGVLRPTLAGMLTLGLYPQQFFPQLFVSFVVFPSRSKGELGPEGERYLDNRTVEGTIPEMVAGAVRAMRTHMSRTATVRGIGREERTDYPVEVLREVFVNALMHRDYSPHARGAQVQVELYPDRLTVRSPGGLFGSVTADTLGTPEASSSSRNATLAKLLADVPLEGTSETVAENRGTGLIRVSDALRRVGMSPPEFEVTPAHVDVTVFRTALLSPAVVDWIGTLGEAGLSNDHHLALAMLHSTGRVNAAMLRAWGVERHTASEVLRDLVDRGLALRWGGRRYASYHLAPEAAGVSGPADDALSEHEPAGGIGDRAVRTAGSGTSEGIEGQLSAIRQAIAAGHVTTKAIGSVLGIGYQTILRRLRVLQDRGEVQRIGAPNSP